jgi:predicted RNase H-like HicB family nuclease
MSKAGTKRYAVVIERTETGYGAYVPDLPGCVAAAETYEETDRLIREAIPFHIEGLRLRGTPVPEPSVRVEFVEAETTA